MKYLTLLILFFLCLNVSKAQHSPTLFIHMGKSLSGNDFNSKVEGLAKHTTFSIDKPLSQHLSLGVHLEHKKIQLANNIKDTIRVVGGDTVLGIRGHYTFRKKARTELYLGGMVGYQIIHLKKEVLQDENLNLSNKRWQAKGISTLQIGLRYYPKVWYGYFLEVGLGNESAALGISIKF